MSTKLYNTLSEFDGEADGIHWYCRTCNSTAKSMMTMMTTLQTQHTKLEASVSDLKNDMKECKRECTESHSKLEKEIRDCKQECSGINAQPNTQTKEETSVILDQLFHDKMVAIEEREKRRSNIILFRLPESTSDEPIVRKKDDETKVKSMLDGLPDRGKLEIKSLYRLGRRTDEKARPLKVIMGNQTMRDDVLSGFRDGKLDLSSYDEGSIQFSRDRTKAEREDYRKLRKELNDRKEKGESDLIIRNGRIMKRTFFPRGEESA